MSSHELLLGALGTQDVLSVRDEALANKAALAHGADETVVVPVSVFERDVPGAADAFENNPHTRQDDSIRKEALIFALFTGDGLGAGRAPLGEQLSETLGAVGLVVLGREPLSCKRLGAVCAREALFVPGLILVRHAARRDYLQITNELVVTKDVQQI